VTSPGSNPVIFVDSTVLAVLGRMIAAGYRSPVAALHALV
jgi:hypothetical protein